MYVIAICIHIVVIMAKALEYVDPKTLISVCVGLEKWCVARVFLQHHMYCC